MMESNYTCILCVSTGNRCGGETVEVTRGLNKIRECSSVKGDGINDFLEDKSSILVHVKCRKDYTRNIGPASNEISRPKVARLQFDFKTQCIFCEKYILSDVSKLRNQVRQEYSIVTTLEFVHSLRCNAEKRNDDWGKSVLVRLASVIDLVAAEGRYHRQCYQYFLRPGSALPGSAPLQGRQVDEEKSSAFQLLCKFLEDNDECQFTIDELLSTLNTLNPTEVNVYSKKHLKRKLEKHYGEFITITETKGKCSTVCFSGCSSRILTDKWYGDRKIKHEDEVKRVIETAAKLIRQEIRSRAYDCDVYPSVEEIESGNNNLAPPSLKLLIDGILKPKKPYTSDVKEDRKSLAIQHAIISAVRPRSFVSPLHVGLGVHLHRKYGSRLLIDMLSNLGYCATYKEVTKFEAAITAKAPAYIDNSAYIQFVFDNADYNVATLDGHRTFHAMGGIVCATPANTVHVNTPVPRTGSVSSATLGTYGQTKVEIYRRPPTRGYSLMIAEDVRTLSMEPTSAKKALLLDALWMCGSWLQLLPCPGWSGFMSNAHSRNTDYSTSAIVPLPFVNLDPGNPSTIYTCLLYAAEQCDKYKQSCCMVTFDQPLYVKACEMILAADRDSALSRVVVRLGGFHLLLSFMGAVGHIMAGSGLEDLWKTVYATNSVTHMMTGRAYSRGLRAHLLTQHALATLMLESFSLNDTLINDLKECYISVNESTSSLEDIKHASILQEFVNLFDTKLEETASSGRTEKLWVQYIKLVGIMRLFVRAERSGDWHLHLYSVQLMLPYLHAAGHLHYAKAGQLYLQQMLKIETIMKPEEFNKFVMLGYFTVRRSDKYWSGIWTDMTIEQVLMRNLKTTGGLTRGRGIAPSTIAKWIHSMPAASKVVDAMEGFCGVSSSSTEQHIELRESRQSRDMADVKTFLVWLRHQNPFLRRSPLLASLSSGVVATEDVNCDNALSVGTASMKAMEGKLFSDIHLQRRNSVKSLENVAKTMKVRDEEICINPNQLFHRLVCIVRSEEDLACYLKYELAARPPALFDDCSFRKGNKSSFIPVLQALAPCECTLPSQSTYVVDGGYLLHHVVWQRPATYSQICSQYTSYIKEQYGCAHIVFDGYNVPSTKDEEHSRRAGKSSSRQVIVENQTQASLSQQDFFSNTHNKIEFITLLSSHLEAANCTVYHASADADCLIVNTAIRVANTGATSVLVGEDTDLLILMCALAKPDTEIKMFIPGNKSRSDKLYSSKALQSALGEMVNSLLFIHAVTGCDTTSAPYRKGKKIPFKRLTEDAALRTQVQVFNNPNSSADVIAAAGEAFLLRMYGAKPDDSLDKARYHMYLRTVAKQKVNARFDLAILPPTTAAARQHSLRVFHQVQQWRGIDLLATDWGWKLESGRLRPVLSLKEPAPQSLLHLVVCNCKSGCERKCECRQSGLPCSQMCGYCVGHGCSNRNCNYPDDVDDEIELEETIADEDY